MSRLRKLPFITCVVLALSVGLPPVSAAQGPFRSIAEDAQRLLRVLESFAPVGDRALLKARQAQSKGTLHVKKSCGIDPDGKQYCTP